MHDGVSLGDPHTVTTRFWRRLADGAGAVRRLPAGLPPARGPAGPVFPWAPGRSATRASAAPGARQAAPGRRCRSGGVPAEVGTPVSSQIPAGEAVSGPAASPLRS